MKYFLDTEFLEGPQKKTFCGIPIGYTKPTIDLISIGIVAEDLREYYEISKDFNLKEAWNRYDLEQQSGDMRNIFPEGRKVYWLRENVLKPIWRELFFQADDCSGLSNKQTEAFYQGVVSGEYDHYFTFKSLKLLIEKYGKTNKEIAEEVKSFCSMGTAYSTMDKTIADVMYFSELDSETKKTIESKKLIHIFSEKPEFYAYFADYDWVVFCWLFGKMMDLPKGFPMYCKDLKQMLDDKVMFFWKPEIKRELFLGIDPKYKSIDEAVSAFKTREKYPIQDPSKSHNAIEDARWNKQLYDFLNKL
jgi:hypothetical protein